MAASRTSHNDALYAHLARTFGEAISFDVPMSGHTSWRVGGNAQVLFAPRSEACLAAFVRIWPCDMPLHWVGLGSNLLVRDAGIAGAVITTKKLPNNLVREDEFTVSASAGVPCTTLSRQLVRWSLGPSEFFAGIPGSLGGALTMNAGAHGNETWDVVKDVRLLDAHGTIQSRDKSAFEVSYRTVSGQGHAWFISARLQFDPQYKPSAQHMRTLQDKRKLTQPLGLPSCGSVFRNPPGDHAARLIETAGLKGTNIGGAQVSPKHANFIINTGDAAAADIESLITHVMRTVKAQHGVELRHEVRFIGDAA